MGWQELGFLTWELFCESRLHKPAVEIEAEATLRKHGGDRRSEQYNNQLGVHQVENASDKGTTAAYLKARIARDHPETLKAVGKGKKYRTVYASMAVLGSRWNIRISLMYIKLIL